jgi:hypothetical protein
VILESVVPAASSPRALQPRHVQLARAAIAAIAAVMVTFTADHSAATGLAVFSGFTTTTGLVLMAGAWLVPSAGRRAVPVALASVSLVAGMVSGVAAWRTTTLLFAGIIVWALVTGLIEGVDGWRRMRRAAPGTRTRSDARDAVVVGAVTVVLGAGMLLVNSRYALHYVIPEAGRSFTLTGTAIAVGIFGAYAAVVAVYLAIAGLSPRPDREAESAEAAASEERAQ